ncbi:hypothetical protein [Kitasatospora sp. NPDC093102]|uniref:hypothetical protein n=1 Tax=Kitasatospora sp. NPDC093102 TaxID=3155069 RepID=UPI00342EF31C
MTTALHSGAAPVAPAEAGPGPVPGAALTLIQPSTAPHEPARTSRFDPTAVAEPTLVPGVASLIALPAGNAERGLARIAQRYLRRNEAVHDSLSTTAVPATALGRLGRNEAGRLDMTFASLGDSEHRLWVSTPGLRDILAEPPAETVVVFGSCLFSGRSLRLSSPSGPVLPFLHGDAPAGAPVGRVEWDGRLSLYEQDTVARLSSAVAQVVRALGHGRRIRLVLDLPRTQYLLKLWEWHEAGALTDRTFRALSLVVDERTDLLHDHVLCRLRAFLPPDRQELVGGLARADELGAVMPATEHPAPGTRPATVAELTGLLGRHDPGWDLATRVSPPRSLLDVVRMSYLTGIVREVLDGPGPVVLVDDPKESGLLVRSRRILDHATAAGHRPADRLGGFFALSRLLTVGGRHGSSYFLDPGHGFLLPDGEELDTEHLVARAYGAPRP